jgi:predicted ATPase
VRAALQTARELSEQLLSLAQRIQDPALLLVAHRSMGFTLHFLGEEAPARAYLEQGMALYDPQQHRSLAFLYGRDPGVDCHVYTAWALWPLGYPDQALQRSHEALTLAQELAHPYSLIFALSGAATLHQLRREEQAAQARAEATMTLSTERGFPQWLAWGTILRGWALARQGRSEEGIAQMRQGLAGYQATGGEVTRPYFLSLLAEAYGDVGQTAEGLSLLDEALATVQKTGGRWCEAELYRLKGELLLRSDVQRPTSNVGQMAPGISSAAMEAEACFRQALDAARRQQAKSWELRAAMSLSRLWQGQDKRAEARQLLAGIYGWFTEGFDTADLREAKALFEELS